MSTGFLTVYHNDSIGGWKGGELMSQIKYFLVFDVALNIRW